MTTGPRIRRGESLLPGVLAGVLFVVMATITLNTSFATAAGFPDGISITAEIGYAMFDFGALQSSEGGLGNTEPFLASFILIAIVLDAALDASLVLAKREDEGEPVTALSSVGTASSGGVTGGQPAATDGGHTGETASHGGERK